MKLFDWYRGISSNTSPAVSAIWDVPMLSNVEHLRVSLSLLIYPIKSHAAF